MTAPHRPTSRPARVAGALVAATALLVLAACGTDDGDGSPTDATGSSDATASASPTPSEQPPPASATPTETPSATGTPTDTPTPQPTDEPSSGPSPIPVQLDLTADDGVLVQGGDLDSQATPTRPDAVSVVVYEDLLCPGCAALAADVLDPLETELDTGRITLEHRVVAVTGDGQGADASVEAANAAWCVYGEAGPEGFTDFLYAAYDEQPTYPDGFDPDRLTALASDVGAEVGSCIEAGTYAPAVEQATTAVLSAGVTGFPQVEVAGTVVRDPTLASVRAAIRTAR